MQLTDANFGGAVPVEGYGPGFFRVEGQVRPGPLLICPTGPRAWSGLDDTAPILALAPEVDVVFFGMGNEILPVPGDLRRALEAMGVGAEPMASASAARTYNVLLAEGRRVAAALLPIGAP